MKEEVDVVEDEEGGGESRRTSGSYSDEEGSQARPLKIIN